MTELTELGFAKPSASRRKRQCWLGSGKRKTRKTSFGMGFPQPIGLLNIDRDLEDVLVHYPHVDIIVKDLSREIPFGTPMTQQEAQALESDFARCLKALFDNKSIRTVMLDKETTLWEIIRYAEFGRLANVKARNYEAPNLRMRGYLSAYQDSDKNFYMTADVKDEWQDDKPTGKVIHDGFKQAEGIAQVISYFACDGPDFKLTIEDCVNSSLKGLTVSNEAIDFKNLATLVMPESQPSDWA